ncbi:MAG: protein kinase [Thermoanaerobaculales bacterium]|nr:protein kinase [Thermoanaerobaculales bacterium]
MPDLIGHTLGHYRIVEKIGEGGMGVVYRAHDERLDRDVAIKVLPEEVAQSSDRLARFEREAKAVAKLDHPNILAIHDFGSDEGVTYAVTELLSGQNLRQAIPASGMPWQKVVEIGAAIADGLAAAHGRGIVHRDLKPENVFITSDGRVKVLDFGLARVKEPVEEDAETATLTPAGTVPGSVLGTMGYMSPEQLRGEQTDARSDIFALGCVLYEMLSGKAAFVRKSAAETSAAILGEEPERVSSTGIVLPTEVERSIHRCLEKSPDARFQSASDLAYNIKSISTDQMVSVPPAQRKPRTTRLVIAAAFVLVLVALAVLLGPVLLDRSGSDEETQSIHSIAILPLQNLTGDPEQAYFVDGLHEELIATFAQISAFDKVIARTSVMGFKDSDTPIREIGRQLGVEAVLEGSVRRSGDTVRTTVQLIEASTENHLWTNSFESDLTDILVLQSDVARAVANEVELALTPEDEARLASALQVNPEAYEAYLKGISHLYKLTPPELDAALHYFEQALETDPDYALAYTGISFVWAARQQMGLVIPSEATPKAKDAAQRALELDDSLPEVHYMWAAIKTWIDWDWEGGEQAFKRALELNPNFAEALVYYSHLLCYMGRLDEALAAAERAMQLDPLNSVIMTISGVTLAYLGRYDAAIERYQNALRTSPNDPIGHNGLWETYYKKRMYDESLMSAKAFFAGLGFVEIAEVMAQGYEEDGYSGAMTSAAETMEAFSKQTYFSPVFLAQIYALAGDQEKTIEWLEMGYEIQDPNMPYVSSFTFDLLDDDPRYQDLLRRMNLPED